MSSISSSSSPSHISPSNKVKRTVSQAPIIVGSQTQSKKRSNPSIGKKHPPMTEAQELMDKINKCVDSTVTVLPPPPQKQIYWVEPGPGYGNPMNFKDIPDGETVTFTNWFRGLTRTEWVSPLRQQRGSGTGLTQQPFSSSPRPVRKMQPRG